MLTINFNNDYALYSLTALDGTTLHLGIVPFSQLTAFDDVPDELKQGMAYMSVLMTDIDRMKLANHALQTEDAILRDRLTETIQAWSIKPTSRTVVCNETKEKWSTATACAEAHDLCYPALLNHLAGRKSFNTVKGRTYRRVKT